MAVSSSSVIERAMEMGSAELAFFQVRFFKTGKGQYGEGDKFLGLVVPQSRNIAKEYKSIPLIEIIETLKNPYHEVRLIALFILIYRFERGNENVREKCVGVYLDHLDFVNNWDLVDTSAYKILGSYLLDHPKKISIIWDLAKSNHLWRERVAVVSTLAFIRKGLLTETFQLCEYFLKHPHDLMHKACGWMLREAGKKDKAALIDFLESHAVVMPRTVLRYALEKVSPEEKAYFMKMGKSK